MQILALLDAEAFRRVRAAIAPTHELKSVDVDVLHARFAEPGSKLLIIDPSQIRPVAFAALVDAAARKHNVAILVYTPLTIAMSRVAVQATLAMPIEFVFTGSANERQFLARACEQLLTPSVAALVWRGLATELSNTPGRIAARLVGMFGGQPIPRSTFALLNGLGVPADTVSNWFAESGLAHPRYVRFGAIFAQVRISVKLIARFARS